MKRSNSSMQLTRAADYGVRVMIHLASNRSIARLSLRELAQLADAPESFLSKVLQELTRGGLISSRRGQTGGFQISERGRRASMLQVVEAIDGPISLNACLVTGRSCRRKSWCPAHPVWAKAQQAMVTVLENVTVSELAVRPGQAGDGCASSCNFAILSAAAPGK